MIFLLSIEVAPLIAQQPKPSQILDQYRSQRITWTTNIWPFANALFGILATIEFAWSAAVMLLEKSDLQSWTSALIRKMMWISAFYALLLNGRTWIPAIIDSFEQIGETSSGFNSIAPSDVFAQGIDIAGALMGAASTSAFFTNTGVCLSLVIAAALIVLAFTGICIQFIVAMVESYIVVAAGYIFLGFGGSRWTVPYTERYIGLAVSTGVKIMLLYLLIGTGMNISVTWMTDAQQVGTSTHPAMGAFEIMGAALIFLMLCWQIPKLFSAVLGGSPALTGGDLLSAGTAVVAGAATVASLGAGAIAAVAGGAAAMSGGAGAAGGGGSGSMAGVGGAMGASGRAGGGTVPPPSIPPMGPSSGGGPRQPNPPGFSPASGSASASSPPATSSGGGGYQASVNSAPSSAIGDQAFARSTQSSVGGDGLAGSGFEGERPAAGFLASVFPLAGRSTDPPATPPALPASSSSAFSDQLGRGTGVSSPASPIPEGHSISSQNEGSQQPAAGAGERLAAGARRTQGVFSAAAKRMRGVRRQLGGLPSDAASHVQPPRMPIDHGE